MRNNKQGVTLVALVITMVVMAIFISSIIFVGVGSIEEAQLAEFISRVSKVEEAVNLKISANMLKYAENDLDYYQWVGAIEGYTESDAQNGIALQVAKEINGISVYTVETDILDKLKITENQNNYYVDIDGTVYYDYYMYKGITYYNEIVTSAEPVVPVTPEEKILTGITITTAPTKVAYDVGEEFNSTGMVVTATYSDSTTSAVIGYTTSPSGALATTDTSVTVSYTENGVTKTTTQAITVNAVVLIPLIDGTYSEAKGVNSPKLDTGMTAVYWDNGGNEIRQYNGGVLNSAFVYNDWYDYTGSTQEYDTDYTASKWANAVTEDGSYWVWIPRYAYMIGPGFHSATSSPIEIEFLKGTTNETASGRTIFDNTLGQGNWNIHPAFRYNDGTDKILSGIWVAKYEMSMEQNGEPTETTNSTIGNVLTTDIIKAVSVPGVSSWRWISIANCFTNSLNIHSELQSHLMMNREWGAVAYLTQSKYGRNGKEVEMNDTDYITGASVGQSTTGNKYGIFDMNGGAWEYVAAGLSANVASTFGSANAKYYEGYGTYGDRYGDAVYEISTGASGFTSWHGDTSNFVESIGPFFSRGGRYNDGSDAGLFLFSYNGAGGYESASFRSVLWGGL